MKTLFICHSVGDTHTAIKIAKELLKKVQNEAFFLAIHPNAQKCLTRSLAIFNQERIHITNLDELFESSIQKIPDAQLNAQIINYVEDHHIQNALVGTPSHNTETRFFDIAKTLTTYFSNQHVFVYNDYLFEDTTHAYWTILNKESSWEKQIHWLAPFPGIDQKVTEKNSDLTFSDVSHPLIDEALTREAIETEAVHPALASDEHYAFIYISDSKDPDQDIEFLTALFQGLSADPAHFGLRLGIHFRLRSDQYTYLINPGQALIKSFSTLSTHIKIPTPSSDPHTCTEIDKKIFSQNDVANTPKLLGKVLTLQPSMRSLPYTSLSSQKKTNLCVRHK